MTDTADSLPSQAKPRLGFVGPMLGKHPGWVVSQGEILARLFADAGYQVEMTSTQVGRVRRLMDTVWTLRQWRGRVDVIVLAVFSGLGFVVADAASLVARQLGIPLIHVLRGGALPEFADRHPRWVGRVLRRAQAIVSPSGFLAHVFQQRGFDCRVIPNVLRMERYPYRHRECVEPRLLWMRTFHPIYHPEMAVLALESLRRTHPRATLTMAGQDRGLEAPTRALVEARGLAAHVRFAGFLDSAGKQREFAEHDIYLHTNRVDNMPVSVVEAGAFGLPVVATRVGGIPYLVEHERTALIVPSEDAEAMASAVRRLCDEPGLAGRLSAEGRALAERSSWPAVRDQWEELFTSLGATNAQQSPKAT